MTVAPRIEGKEPKVSVRQRLQSRDLSGHFMDSVEVRMAGMVESLLMDSRGCYSLSTF